MTIAVRASGRARRMAASEGVAVTTGATLGTPPSPPGRGQQQAILQLAGPSALGEQEGHLGLAKGDQPGGEHGVEPPTAALCLYRVLPERAVAQRGAPAIHALPRLERHTRRGAPVTIERVR
ncbi:MAG: hypothetical protein IPN16_19550 [Gemmatimonadetes bacterium]|nr:hypothetical protein [Gemmatimonadota bacterium]